MCGSERDGRWKRGWRQNDEILHRARVVGSIDTYWAQEGEGGKT